MSTATAVQRSFDELGTPLREVTFVVVDLETTGGSPAGAEITEVGAVKVRGGETLGEFQSLVRPAGPIPPFIATLTGITDSMVAAAPGIGAVLPAFLEFTLGTILVAHNAPFDLGFLRAACQATDRAWPDYCSVDTARLARRVLTRDEAPDCRLATLSRLFPCATAPCHRALADARATVAVLHGLLERVGNLGVASLEELASFTTAVPAAVRRKRHLALDLPHAPGVYLFRGPSEEVLYIGRSGDLQARVRSYFTAAETRGRIAEMVALAVRVDHVVCATELEAEVRELRLIRAHAPRYNRRSRWPDRALWLKVTREPFPRLAIVRGTKGDGADYLGPFGSRRSAELARDALLDAVPVRRCTVRLSPRRPAPACALAEMGRCAAPCDGRVDPAGYAVQVQKVTAAIRADPGAVVAAAERRLAVLVPAQRFEEAAMVRDRVAAFVRTAARCQRVTALGAVAQLVAARRGAGNWEVAVVRYGRLAASGRVPTGPDVRAGVDRLVAAAEMVPTPDGLAAATVEEVERVLAWLETPGVRLVELTGCWSSPAWGAGQLRRWPEPADGTHHRYDPADRPPREEST
ncbi:MAG: DEDD exonuclease domain-containing protein [Mycobacteriales bacterium]